MNILVANLGSTSLKWRLFDCANGAERLLHKGGFERVTECSKAIDDCLGQLRDAGAIATERDVAAVGFKTVIAKGVTGCVRLDERVLGAMEAYTSLAPAHNPVGDLDPEALPYAVNALGISLEEARRQLSKESGLKG